MVTGYFFVIVCVPVTQTIYLILLYEIILNLFMKYPVYNSTKHKGGTDMSVKRTLMMVGLGIFGIVALIAVFTSWYTVDESEQAVVITFGTVLMKR